MEPSETYICDYFNKKEENKRKMLYMNKLNKLLKKLSHAASRLTKGNTGGFL